jgi:hypothetical protein
MNDIVDCGQGLRPDFDRREAEAAVLRKQSPDLIPIIAIYRFFTSDGKEDSHWEDALLDPDSHQVFVRGKRNDWIPAIGSLAPDSFRYKNVQAERPDR